MHFFALLWKAVQRYIYIKKVIYRVSESCCTSVRLTICPHSVCALTVLPQCFPLKVKETISLACTTIDFLPFPQPVQRMSYFKGQDGGRSQVTSFYRSTPQISRLPSRARQKAALRRSTGKLPHQSSSFPSPGSTVLLALAPHPRHVMKIYRCLIARESSTAASTEIKDCTDSY